MRIKTLSRNIEKPLLCSFIVLWLAVYLSSRFFLEMYTDRGIFAFWPWTAVACSPFCLYAAIRTVNIRKEKWYGMIGYFLIYGFLTVSACGYIIVQGEILLSAARGRQEYTRVRVIGVRKVFKRKLGFDHTAVTLQLGNRKINMEARPYAYFYLRGKKELKVALGRSALKNDYATSLEISMQEKLVARWLHFKDMFYRMRLLWAFLALLFLGILIIPRYLPRDADNKPKPLSFWKQMGIVMAALIGIGILFYAALWIYVLFFK